MHPACTLRHDLLSTPLFSLESTGTSARRPSPKVAPDCGRAHMPILQFNIGADSVEGLCRLCTGWWTRPEVSVTSHEFAEIAEHLGHCSTTSETDGASHRSRRLSLRGLQLREYALRNE